MDPFTEVSRWALVALANVNFSSRTWARNCTNLANTKLTFSVFILFYLASLVAT